MDGVELYRKQAMTTAELIKKLQELDPDGTKDVGIEIPELRKLKTDLSLSGDIYWTWIIAE